MDPISGDFRNSRGQNLATIELVPSTPARAAVFYHHGYGNHARRSLEYLQALCAAGLHVFAYDAHGHGRSDPQRPNHLLINDFNDLVDDLRDYVNQVVRPKAAGKPVLLSGISMGGLAVTIAAIKDPDICQGLILLAPALDAKRTLVLKIMAALAGVGNMLIPHVRLVSAVTPEKSTQDPLHIAAMREDPLMDCGPLRVRTAVAFTKAFKFVREHQKQLKTPLIALIGTDDHVVDDKALQLFVDESGSKDKSVSYVPGAWHDLITGAQRETTFKMVIDWIDLRIGHKQPVQ